MSVDDAHTRPPGTSDATVAALGKLSEALEVVEEYDDGYYAAFKEHEKAARDELMDGKRHVFEAEMKQDRRTHGRPGHAATPHGEKP